MAGGQVIGSILGGVAGSIIPGVGTAVGAAAGGAVGSGFDAMKAKKKADASFPDNEAPQLNSYLSSLQRKLRATETGSYASNKLNDFKLGASKVSEGIGYGAGGSNAATNQQLLSRNLGDSFNKVLAGIDERSMGYESLAAQLVTRISERRDQLGLAKYSQAKAEEMQGKKNLMQTINAGAGYLDGTNQSPEDDTDFNWLDLFSNGEVTPTMEAGGGFSATLTGTAR